MENTCVSDSSLTLKNNHDCNSAECARISANMYGTVCRFCYVLELQMSRLNSSILLHFVKLNSFQKCCSTSKTYIVALT